jgi:hypothetical protein
MVVASLKNARRVEAYAPSKLVCFADADGGNSLTLGSPPWVDRRLSIGFTSDFDILKVLPNKKRCRLSVLSNLSAATRIELRLAFLAIPPVHHG